MTGRRLVEVFVAPNGNAFMADIADWIAEAARELGHDASVVADGSLPVPGRDPEGGSLALVVAPHEFYELSEHPVADLRRAAAGSIPIATEQPGTSWFARSLHWCRRSPFTLDINASAVEAATAAGVDARWLRLGAVPSMNHVGEGPRDVDVTVLAGLTDSRAERLAGLATTLWRHRCELRLFPADQPIRATTARSGPLFGAQKYELLARSRILLNLHRDESTTYFEWARVVEAMANGCVVVSEPSDAISPLVDGEHLVLTDDPATTIEALLADTARTDRISAAAAAVVHGELALSASLAAHLDDAFAAVASTSLSPQRSPRTLLEERLPGFGGVRPAPRRRAPRPAFRPHRALRRRLLDEIVAERELRRDIDAELCRIEHGSPDHLVVVDSATWETASPDVSAIVTMFDYGDVVTEALDSLAASEGVTAEIVVVDDHSTDDGRAVVTEWIAAHPELPVRLLGRDANGGLAAARNLAIEHTRTDRVMVLDADNQVVPTCLSRLAAALDDDPEAAFAWSILEVFGARPGLLSAHAWDPDRLVERNSIDAQVMLRRSVWEEFGGYRQLPGLLLGWEDWDLWLRFVERDLHGVLVPEILGRYRAQPTSMVSGPNRFTDIMLERFEAAHPDLTFPPR